MCILRISNISWQMYVYFMCLLPWPDLFALIERRGLSECGWIECDDDRSPTKNSFKFLFDVASHWNSNGILCFRSTNLEKLTQLQCDSQADNRIPLDGHTNQFGAFLVWYKFCQLFLRYFFRWFSWNLWAMQPSHRSRRFENECVCFVNKQNAMNLAWIHVRTAFLCV